MKSVLIVASLAALAALAACDRAKDRQSAGATGPLSQATAPAAPAAGGVTASVPAEPPVSQTATLRPGFPGFYLDRIDNQTDPLKKPATVDGSQPMEFAGFGFDGVAKKPAKGVDLDIDGHLFGTTYGQSRPDVARFKGVAELDHVGYKATLSPGTLQPGPHTVMVRVVSADGTQYDQSPPIRFTVR